MTNIFKHTFSRIFLSIVLLLLVVQPAQAGFAIAPGKIYREHLKPGAEIEQEIVVSRSEADEDLVIRIEPELEEMADWFSFEPGMEVDMPAGEKNLKLKAIIKVPKDTPYQTYEGLVRIKGGPKEVSKSGVSVVQGARMDLQLTVTEKDVNDLIVRDIKFLLLEGQNPLHMILKIENQGNVAVAPRVEVDILDIKQKPIETVTADKLDKVQPNTEATLEPKFDTSVGTGEYFANVRVYLEDILLREDRLVFEVKSKEAGTPGEIVMRKATNLVKKILTPEVGTKLALGVSLAVNTVLLVLIARKELKKKGKKKWKKLHLSKLIGALQVIFLVVFVGNWIWNPFAQPKKVEPEPGKPVPVAQEEKQTVDEEQTNQEADLADSTSANPKVKGVMNIEEISLYQIYAEPNYQADVVYLAQDGEQFDVVEKHEGWYLVDVRGQRRGWLPTRSVVKEEKKR